MNSSQADGWYHPKGYNGPIERDGLMLMERPAAMTQEAINDGIKAARKGWLRREDVINCLPLDEVKKVLGSKTGR